VKLATARHGSRTAAVRIEGDTLVELPFADVGALLATPGWQAAAAVSGPTHSLDGVTLGPVVPQPSKVVCVGLNYRNHIQEMGRDLPEYPTLFSKFADCLVGATDDVVRPPETTEFDWEVELAVVIGTPDAAPVRRADDEQAAAAIAGFTILNDVTCRDWQFRTREWLQGKSWDSTTPVGPWLVTPDEVGGVRPALEVTCSVDGTVMQSDTTADLLFDPVALVRYVSTMVRLNPGDIIATGTPGGVGHARKPPVYLTGGELLVTEIEGLGRLENRVVAERLAAGL
jgi:acylpyruvate hydrolase